MERRRPKEDEIAGSQVFLLAASVLLTWLAGLVLFHFAGGKTAKYDGTANVN